jgi:Tol biopolymer transport system component
VLTWFDRTGKPTGTLGEPARHGGVQLSHDGTRVAVPTVDPARGTHDIWLYDIARPNGTRFTFDPGDETTPVWSHDDSRIVFSAQRGSSFSRLDIKQANGTGGHELLLENPSDLYPSDWSVDGRSMLYLSGFTASSTDTLWVLPVARDRKPQRFAWSTAPQFLSWAYFSPDGRWVAYGSSESGRSEIYVVPSDGSAGRWRISRGEGALPRWRRDGREIYYLEGMSRLMAAAVDGRNAAFQVGAVNELFSIDASATGARPYDVRPDGQSFLVNARQAGARQAPVTVVSNWTAGLLK